MVSSRIRVFPASVAMGNDFMDAFEEMWEALDSVSRLPGCLVTGDFPPTDVMVDSNENYIIQMSVAGYPEEGINLNFKDDYLTITVNPDEKKYEGYTVKMKGIRNSKAERKFLVPSKDFMLDKAEATTKNGVLTVVIPRREETKPINIKVKAK